MNATPEHRPADRPPGLVVPIESGRRRPSDAHEDAAGRLAMRLFLASLGMLFAAGVVGHLVIRLRQPEWPPAGSPALPAGLWLATVILVAISVLLTLSERAARRDADGSVRATLAGALALGVAFLVVQVWNWSVLATAVVASGQNLFTFTYWALTVLHALHVLGGLIPLALMTARAGAGRYRRGRTQPVANVAWYWHFLGITWLAIVAVLAV